VENVKKRGVLTSSIATVALVIALPVVVIAPPIVVVVASPSSM
jgi:hypothetical protein